jgi:hypothetical protein
MLPSSAASFLKIALPEAVIGLVEAEAGGIAAAAADDEALLVSSCFRLCSYP